jgi:hypothetical protein
MWIKNGFQMNQKARWMIIGVFSTLTVIGVVSAFAVALHGPSPDEDRERLLRAFLGGAA